MLAKKLLASYFYKNLKINSRCIVSSIYPDIQLERKTFGEFLFSCFDKHSNKIALIDDTRKINYSYSDLKSSTKSIASALVKKGVSHGTMAGIIASNSPEYFMLIMALTSMGCTVTLCNQNFTEKELQYQLMDSKPSIIFTNDEYLEKVSKTASQLSTVKDIYLIGSRKAGYESVDDLMKDSGNMNPIGQLNVDLDNHIAMMPYSSGTTGLPKGVMLSNSNIVAGFSQINVGHHEDTSKKFLLVLPLYHIYAVLGVTSMAFSSGTTMVVQPSFHPIKYLTAIAEHSINVLHVVPPLVLFLLNHPDVSKFDLSSIKKIISGGSPLDNLTENRIIEKLRLHQPGFDIYQGYGLTETGCSTCAMPNAKKLDGKLGSIGLLLPNMQCKIVDPSTKDEVPPHQSGELLLRGPNVMKGYFGKSSASTEVFENGWFKTGDIGYYDKDQYFFIVDRMKDLIKVKGYQVSPTELETTLLAIPGIVDCAVIGVPDERDGEVPKAFIVNRGQIQEKEIHEYMNNHLSAYKQLKGGIVFVKDIPKNASGKILRNLLRSK